MTAVAMAIGAAAGPVIAAPTGFAPDAWPRGNDANTSYFGWDEFEIAGPPNFGPLYMLDDASPDLGSGITAANMRIFQGADGAIDSSPTTNGHVSSSRNYYSFLNTANDTITATAPASDVGGFTTVVLQAHSSSGGDSLGDLQFAMSNSADTWTLQKHLHGMGDQGLGVHWVEWTAPGAGQTFNLQMTSFAPHRTIDSFEIDTFWSAGGPVVNAITQVPEPTTWVLFSVGLAAGLPRRRTRTQSQEGSALHQKCCGSGLRPRLRLANHYA